MRLGDLDALKEDLKQYFSDGTLDSVSAKLAFNMILRKIDNAPTVEPEVYMNGKDYNLYLEGYKQGKKDFERPQDDIFPMKIVAGKCPIETDGNCPLKSQGEWVRKEDIMHYIATQYSEHNELVPVWLSIGDMKGGKE